DRLDWLSQHHAHVLVDVLASPGAKLLGPVFLQRESNLKVIAAGALLDRVRRSQLGAIDNRRRLNHGPPGWLGSIEIRVLAGGRTAFGVRQHSPVCRNRSAAV